MNTCIQILNSETAQVLGPIFCPQCKKVDKEDALNTAQVHPCWNRVFKACKICTMCHKSRLMFYTLQISINSIYFTTCVQILCLYKIYTISLSMNHSHWNILKSFTLYGDTMTIKYILLICFDIPELKLIFLK